MALLWIRDQEIWSILLLDNEDLYHFTSDPSRPLQGGSSQKLDDGSVVLLSSRSNKNECGYFEERWIILANPSRKNIRVNGDPLSLQGIHVLQDRDEILLPGLGRLYFSSESLPAVQPFPEAKRQMLCPRCRRGISHQSQAVKCPRCGSWYHQEKDFLCFTYSVECAVCKRSTELGGSYSWTPEEL